MSEYLVRLLIMLPLVCGVIVAGLFVAKRVMAATPGSKSRGAAKLAETVFLTPGTRLAVVDFADKRLLLAVTKGGVSLLSEAPAQAFALPTVEGGDAR